MGAASDEFFAVQHVKNSQVIDEKIAFADVKSVKLKGQGRSTGVKVGLGVLAGCRSAVRDSIPLRSLSWH